MQQPTHWSERPGWPTMTAERDDAAATVASLADAVLSVYLDLFPIESSLFGLPGRDAALPDHSVPAEQSAHAELDRITDAALSVQTQPLSIDDAITAAVIIGQAA